MVYTTQQLIYFEQISGIYQGGGYPEPSARNLVFQLRQCSVTGPSIGCSPVPRNRACFSAKYHFAGLSASSISISAGPKRSPVAPEIPTIAESAFPGFDVTAWYGFSAPAKTSPAIVKLLYAETLKVLKQPEVQEALSRQGLEVTPKGPVEFAAQIKSETAVWAKLIKAAGIHAE